MAPEEAGGTARQVEDEPYYHGFMSLSECKPLLRSAGDFLIRRAEIDGEMQYVITVLPENSKDVTNFIIKKTRTVSNLHNCCIKDQEGKDSVSVSTKVFPCFQILRENTRRFLSRGFSIFMQYG